MDYENTKLVNRVLKEYYEKNLSQKEISYKENISKSSISRILCKAKEEGLVSFHLNLEHESLEELEEELKRTFQLEEVHVCAEILSDVNSRLKDVSQMLAENLNSLVKAHDVIGMGWGTTLQAVAEELTPLNPVRGGIKVVELCGSITSEWASLNSYEIFRMFAEKTCGSAVIYPVPVLVEDEWLARQLKQDRQIKRVIELAEQARIVIFTAGILESKSVLVQSGALNYEVFGELIRKGAVGDILFHFLDEKGNLIDLELDKRILSLPFESLKKKEIRILIAVGEHRVNSILAALRSGVPNHLYIDERTAIRVLKENRYLVAV